MYCHMYRESEDSQNFDAVSTSGYIHNAQTKGNGETHVKGDGYICWSFHSIISFIGLKEVLLS